MINIIVSTILKLFVWLANMVIGLISLPLAGLLTLLFPDLSSYTSQVLSFVNTYIFEGIRFAKEIVLNTTHFPRPLFRYSGWLYVGFIWLFYSYFSF